MYFSASMSASHTWPAHKHIRGSLLRDSCEASAVVQGADFQKGSREVTPAPGRTLGACLSDGRVQVSPQSRPGIQRPDLQHRWHNELPHRTTITPESIVQRVHTYFPTDIHRCERTYLASPAAEPDQQSARVSGTRRRASTTSPCCDDSL